MKGNWKVKGKELIRLIFSYRIHIGRWKNLAILIIIMILIIIGIKIGLVQAGSIKEDNFMVLAMDCL